VVANDDAFDQAAAERLLKDAFAPWVQDLKLSIENIEAKATVSKADVLADARIVRLGRTMAFGRVTLQSAADKEPVAMVSSAYALL
jgi:acyl-coenzyme A thioesterase PaaI-like protein